MREKKGKEGKRREKEGKRERGKRGKKREKEGKGGKRRE